MMSVRLLKQMCFFVNEQMNLWIIILYINLTVNILLPDSHNTIRSQLKNLFEESNQKISITPKSSYFKTYTICPSWTLPNYLGVLGIVNHFTSSDKSLLVLFFSISKQEKSHS